MTLDSTNSISIILESESLAGKTAISESDVQSGAEVSSCIYQNRYVDKKQFEVQNSWCYLFLHHRRVHIISDKLIEDNIPFFIHKTIRYYRDKDKSKSIRKKEVPTISGLVFIQGNVTEIQSYLDDNFPNYHLCKNCSTGKPAVIPDSQMRPFMRLTETRPEMIRFMLQPFYHYARNHTLIRITSGDFAGLEGYVVRIDRDRKLVMNIGGMTVAISGIHAESFEELRSPIQGQTIRGNGVQPSERRLTKHQTFMDRYFYYAESSHDIQEQAESVVKWTEHAMMYAQKGEVSKAWETLLFLIEEIAFYYSHLFECPKMDMEPILAAGREVINLAVGMSEKDSLPDHIRQEMAEELEKTLMDYGYLFE